MHKCTEDSYEKEVFNAHNRGNCGDDVGINRLFRGGGQTSNLTVTFNSNGGSAVASVTVEEGESAQLPTPTREGYTFDGWYASATLSGSAVTSPYTPTANVTLYAKWKAVVDPDDPTACTITFNTNGGNTIQSQTVEVGDSITLPTPTKEGYTFDGWYANAALSGSAVTSPYTPTANITLYAKWTAVVEPDEPDEPIIYTITFNSNGGTAIDEITVNEGESVTALLTPTREGYTFDGWFVSAALLGSAVISPYTPTANITLYAKWTAVTEPDEPDEPDEPIIYTITFNVNGGTAVAEITVNEGESVTALPTPTREGYTFSGWYANAALSGSAVTSPYAPTANVTLHAKWTAVTEPDEPDEPDEPIIYTVTFNVNGGTAVAEITVSEGESITLLPPTKEGYTFDGWYESEDFTGEPLGESYAPTASVTLNAKWLEIYTVTFNTNGGNTIESKTVKESESITLPTPTKDDFRFSGWFESEDLSGTAVTSPYTPTASVILYAKWTAIDNTIFSYTVTNNEVTITGISDDAATDVIIPSNIDGAPVTSIGGSAFYGCDSLSSVTIGSSVTTIGNQAFYNCSSLTSVTIGNSVTSISSSAFSGCYKLVEVYNLSSLNIVAGYSNYGYVGYYAKNVYTPNSGESKLITTDDGFVFYRNESGAYYLVGYNGTATEIVLPDDINSNRYSINDYAFRNCSKLSSVTIPDSVTSIGSSAFSGCKSLSSVIIGNSVTSIGNYAFSGCESLSSITIGSSVTSIGYDAFNGCSALNAVHITDLAAWCSIWFGTNIANPLTYTHNLYLNEALITDLVIPDSVTTIGRYAFYNCSSLTSVTIGNSVTTISGYAFSGCSKLTSVTIGNSVTSIDSSAFEKCSSLNAVHITDFAAWCSISYGNEYANPLYYAHNLYLNGALITDLVIPDSVTTIGKYAFYGCSKLSSVTIGSSVTTIGERAFLGCESLNAVHITDLAAWCNISFGNEYANPLYYAHNLYLNGELITDLVIPDSVTSIGEYAFYGCSSLTAVHITDLAAWCNISFGNEYANPLHYAHNLYLNGEHITDLVIPDSVTSIGDYAFYDYESLTSVTIPNSVRTIGEDAFYGCKTLSSVTIGNSVRTISGSAFEGCRSLTSVTIPNSVTTISDYAFRYCYKLVEVYNLSSLSIVAGSSYYGYVGYYAKNVYTSSSGESKLTTTDDGFVFISDKNGAYYLVGYNGTATELVLPNEFSGNSYSINDSAFRGCSSLTSVTIGNSVTSIGEDAFYGCSKLISVTIGSSVTSIGGYAFRGCESLSSVTIPNSVTSIGSSAFYGCSSLTSVTIGNSVTSIGSYAFRNCSSLTSVTIGSGVTSIGYSAFSDCSKLKEVYYAGSAYSDWAKVVIDSYNYDLTGATRYYYSETQPTTSGNYWHYGADGVTVVKW